MAIIPKQVSRLSYGTASALQFAWGGRWNLVDNLTCLTYSNPYGVISTATSALQRKSIDIYGRPQAGPGMFNQLIGQATGGKASLPPGATSFLSRGWTTYNFFNGIAPMVGIGVSIMGVYNAAVATSSPWNPLYHLSAVTLPTGIAPNAGFFGFTKPLAMLKNSYQYLSVNPVVSVITFTAMQSSFISPETRGMINKTVMFGGMGLGLAGKLVGWTAGWFMAAETTALIASSLTGTLPYFIAATAVYGLLNDYNVISQKPHLKKAGYSLLKLAAYPVGLFNPMYGMIANSTISQWQADLNKVDINSMPIIASQQMAQPLVSKDDPQYYTTIRNNQRRLEGKSDTANPQAIDGSELENRSYDTAASKFSLEDSFQAGTPGATPGSVLFTSQTGGTIELGNKQATVNSEGTSLKSLLITEQTRLEAIVHFLCMKSAVKHPESGEQLSRLQLIMLDHQQSNPQAGDAPKRKLTLTVNRSGCALAYRFIEKHYGADKLKYFEFKDSKTNKVLSETELKDELDKTNTTHNKVLDYMLATNTNGQTVAESIESSYGIFKPAATTPVGTAIRMISDCVASFFKHHDFTDKVAQGESSNLAVSVRRSTT